MQQDKMAELRRIAFMLGAKRCKLEVTEYEELGEATRLREMPKRERRARLESTAL